MYDKLVFGADRVKRVLCREARDERAGEGLGRRRATEETGSDGFVFMYTSQQRLFWLDVLSDYATKTVGNRSSDILISLYT